MGTLKHYRNKYIPIIRKIIFIVFTIIGTHYTYDNLNKFELEFDESVLIFDTCGECYYESISDNTGYTNINGISNFVNNVESDGYTLTHDNSNNLYLDYVFERESDSTAWRLYYSLNNQYVAFLFSNYEASSSGISYIIEDYGNM